MIQNAFRQNILQMRETARTSILSLPGHGSSQTTTYSRAGSDESSTPMLQRHSVYNASGLRNGSDYEVSGQGRQ